MKRKEFLGQLERLLWDIPEQERKEALEFYEDYFEEAGEENESSVIQELGSPGKVAAVIKADLNEGREDHGEYTESGYTDERFDQKEMPEVNFQKNFSDEKGRTEKEQNNWNGTRYRSTDENKGYDGPYRRAGYGGSQRKPARSGLAWALILVLLICTIPVWGGVGIGVIGLIMAVVFGCIGVVAGFLLGGIGMIVGGVIGFVWTLLYQLGSPATAVLSAGVSLLSIAGGILLLTGFCWAAFKVFPVCFRWFVDFIQRVLHRGTTGGDRG